MKVLQVTHYFSPHVGGIEVVAAEVARELVAQGHQVELLTSAIGSTPGERVEDGIRVRRVRAWNVTEDRLGAPFPIFSLALLAAAWRMVGRADIVQIHDTLYMGSWVAAAVCRLRRTPYVVTSHVTHVEHSGPVDIIQRVVVRTFGAFVFKGAARVLPLTRFQKEFVDAAVPGLPMTVLPNGIDPDHYRPADPGEKATLRARYDLPLDEFLVLYVGRPVPKKGFDMVDAAGGPGYRLVFVGVDAESGRGAANIYLGQRNRDEVAEIYRAVDLFVCASRGETPLSVLEAMCSAVPVVLNDDPMLRVLVDEGRGVTFLDMDHASLVTAITAATLDPDLTAGGEAARAVAITEHSWTAHAETLVGVYREILGPDPAERPIRVAVVAPKYAPAVGGVERYAEHVVDILRDTDGFEPVVITTRAGWRRGVDTHGGVQVIRLGAPITLSATPLNPLWWWQLPRLLRRLGIDVVNAHSPVPGLGELACFRSSGAPVVLTYHSGTLVKGNSPVDPLLRAWERWVLPAAFRRADQLVAAGSVSLAYGTGKAEIIPPGVDSSVFSPDDEPRTRTVTYVGRVESASRWKGVQVLIDAFPAVVAAVPDVCLDVVGDGDDVEALRAQAEALGVSDRVRWLGNLPPAEVAARLKRTTVCAVPSLTDAECNPTVLIEAMSSGTAVVGSRVGGIPDNIRDGVNGYLVEPADPVGLADRLTQILSDPELAARMGAAGRERAVQTFDHSVRNERFLTIFRLAKEAAR
ncbi:hypothetical protein Back2_00330 [Nocardioides baekrokdamisoli]|uniref:Uncharacterized protein n=1 Tax=Nocardioides baekrokdamisoli TaxID=1804624 RepID=A0A3G9IBU1_9ACTN|nr:glycosyltransferase family 4 protein [Nocardioides baekrokdamisoli]BBH15746.1 hypothetical protein Back2_00330 [Nocardioides baekrokdamisoli]